MKFITPFLAILLAGYLLRRTKKRPAQSRYDRHGQSDWNKLNNGEDPSL